MGTKRGGLGFERRSKAAAGVGRERAGERRGRPGRPAGHAEREGHGERSRSQLLLKLAGPGNMRILAVNSLAVNGALPLYVESKSVLYTQYSVKKCLVHFMKRLTRSPCVLGRRRR